MAWDEATHEQYSRSRKRYESDVTDEEWEVIIPLLPKPSRKGRLRTTDLREVFDAIHYMLASGCQWQALPKWFPPFTTIRNDVCNWRASGVFDRMLDALHQQERDLPDRSAEPTAAVIDSQFVKTAESGPPLAMTSGRKSRELHTKTDRLPSSDPDCMRYGSLPPRTPIRD